MKYDDIEVKEDIDVKADKKAEKVKRTYERSYKYKITGSKKMLGNETIILNYDFLPVKKFVLPGALTVELTSNQATILKSNPSINIIKEN